MDTTVTMSGLDGVVVADTRLSEVDGERGRLVVAGHDIERLAGATAFEAVAGLLWSGALPQGEALEAVRRALAEGRVRAFEQLQAAELPRFADGMDALRAATARLTAEDGFDTPARLTGAVAVYAAAWARVRAGGRPLAPDPQLSHAADYLRMLTGEPADPARVAGLETYLVTVADHGMNASTFAARVVASTGSDAVSAIVAAIGALKGPLHGGAPGPVLDMLDAIGEPTRAAQWIEAELAAGRRIMGMGHRIYRVRDPRAAVLEGALARLEQAGLANGRLALARAVERAAEGALRAKYPDRPLAANVEFYTAVLLDAVGLDRAAFSPTFAAGRVAGWCAHVLEQRATGRLIRPASRYVGPAPHA
ncbi:citrate synthase [Nannocystis sp. SCPEA4]|uniref:citrate synthase n=1 Tax=Nannocystis sp. SCPEA4 TaxID=2996787 RepID=UPI00226F3E70|nr:citrate synthase [Nannocystis sp. SCPEA4]MCY1060065.1 citrate synthase [Nannocystis sp. SCPEA4]